MDKPTNRLITILVIAALGPLLGGCLTTYVIAENGPRWVAHAAWNGVCNEEQSKARWLTVPPKIDHLLYIPLADDPNTNGGHLVRADAPGPPLTDDNSAYWRFLGDRLKLQRYDVYLRPRLDVATKSATAPGSRPTDPDGIYAVEARAAGDPECADTHWARRSLTGCTYYSYLKDAKVSDYDFVWFNYLDSHSKMKRGRRYVEQIRDRDGHVVANSSTYYDDNGQYVCGDFVEWLFPSQSNHTMPRR